jgi:oxalate decarboxylase/phosphoglucose isomerase-like protein (cupin superfamily)
VTVIRLSDLALDPVVAHDGDGSIGFVRLTERFPLKGDWIFVDFASVPPGGTVGLHQHAADEELYVVVRGAGVATTNGVDEPIAAGSVLVNPPHAVHGIRNDGPDPLEFVVLKVTATHGPTGEPAPDAPT